MESRLNTNVVANMLYPVFKRYDVKRAVLFGSVAKGTAKDGSDLDILVDSNLRGLRFIGLLEDLRQACNMDVDLLDVTHIEKDSLVDKEIKETGVVIYEK